MNKAETVRQLAKQTIEQEQDLKIYLTERFAKTEKMIAHIVDTQATITDNQQVIYRKLETLDTAKVKINLNPVMEELTMMRKQNKELKKQFLINFLLVQVPLLAVLAAYLVVLALVR